MVIKLGKTGWHDGSIIVKDITADGNMSINGNFTFGDASVDSFIIKGRMSTMTTAGAAVDIGASYTYGELMEIRADVSNWTLGGSFTGLYLRTSASLGGTKNLHGLQIVTAMNTSTTSGLSLVMPIYAEMCVKASASSRTLTDARAMEANLSFENQTGTLTLTNNVYCLYAKAQSGTGLADYTKINGIRVSGRDDGTARVFGNALDICNPEATVCSWTNGINITSACATAINISGTGSGATAKAFKGYLTVNNANYGDGYALTESDLTLTGTVAGSVSALSSWIELITGITTGSNMICAQSNGIYAEAASVMTGATVVFGMRMQCLCQSEGDIGAMYPFSIINNTNITTALIQCNAASSDLGVTAASKTTTATYMPIYKDGAGTKYVLLYS